MHGTKAPWQCVGDITSVEAPSELPLPRPGCPPRPSLLDQRSGLPRYGPWISATACPSTSTSPAPDKQAVSNVTRLPLARRTVTRAVTASPTCAHSAEQGEWHRAALVLHAVLEPCIRHTAAARAYEGGVRAHRLARLRVTRALGQGRQATFLSKVP